METNRRTFLQQLSLTFGSILLYPACTRELSYGRFFNETEALTIIAFSEQIIPADEFPGATDAGVVNFIDKQLTGPYIKHQETYRDGIAVLNQSSYNLLNKPFYELSRNEQLDFMEKMEAGLLRENEWKEINQRTFFNLLLDHSMQGFYGSPRHGGNKNYVSYRMMRLDYPHVLGQNRYSSKCNDVKLPTL